MILCVTRYTCYGRIPCSSKTCVAGSNDNYVKCTIIPAVEMRRRVDDTNAGHALLQPSLLRPLKAVAGLHCRSS